MKKLDGPASAVVLSSTSPSDENSLDHPTRVAPVSRSIDVAGETIRDTFPGNSVTVIRVKAKK